MNALYLCTTWMDISMYERVCVFLSLSLILFVGNRLFVPVLHLMSIVGFEGHCQGEY